MKLKKYTVGPFAENTYLLLEAGQAILVDPGFQKPSEFELVQEELASQAAELIAVVLTHAHVDHMMGINQVLETYDVPVYLCDKDRYLWNNYSSQARMFGFNVEPVTVEPEPIPITDHWQLGSFEFDVRYTPGHAPDHVSLYLEEEGLVIAGDALFKEGIGRTDLYKGNFEVLEQSILSQLYSLPGATEVYPGHGPQTTVEYEKANNPFVKGE